MPIMEDSLPNIKTFLANVSASHLRHMVIRFMISILIRHGRNSCMNAASVIDQQPRHRAQASRFLVRYRQGIANLLSVVVSSLLNDEGPAGRYLLIIDSTMVGLQGETTENTYSTGNRKRRPARNRRYSKYKYASKSCHCFVFGLLITPRGLRVPVYLPYYTRRYAKAQKLKHRTQAQLAARIIDQLPVPNGVDIVVLGDTAFDARIVRESCQKRGYHWITPVNANRVMAGPRGKRPRVSSRIKQLSEDRFQTIRIHPSSGGYCKQRRLSQHRDGSKKTTRTYYVCSEKREVHSVGMVMLVFSSIKPIKGKAKRDSTKILMTNATHLSARQVVELYGLRWQIELLFKELKSTLGLHQYRLKRFSAVESWVDLVLITFCYLEWTRNRKVADRRISEEIRQRWQRQRSYGLRQAVLVGIQIRQHLWISRRLKSENGRKTLAKTYASLLAREYRCAA
jgi:hypothetical protein